MRAAGERGFALTEAGVLAGAAVIACAVGMVAMGQGRKSAGLAGSLANLRRIGEAGASYAADFDDQLWAFTWTRERNFSEFDDLQSPEEHLDAIAFQAVDIARRRSDAYVPAPRGSRFVCPWLSTLVLVDYLEDSLPAEWVVSPGDAQRLAWHDQPVPKLGEQGGRPWDLIFGPFGSSYMLMPAFFAPDQRGERRTIEQYEPHHQLYRIWLHTTFGERRASEVLHPGQKVQMAERASFFFGPRPEFWLHREARVPVLLADGSASPRTRGDSNASFRPNDPDNAVATTPVDYVPNTIYEMPARAGGADLALETGYKWTRRGLRGVDFSGERVE